MALENVMRVDGGHVVGADASSGGYIKKTGSTISELVTALNSMTEDQKNRCIIGIYRNTILAILRKKQPGTYTESVYVSVSSSYIIREFKLVESGNSVIYSVTEPTVSNDITSQITSWFILYQDDSTSGGNTYPASQVMMSDGDSVEDRLDANTMGTAVSIKGTSGYVCPSDGYVRFKNDGSSTGNTYLSLVVNDVVMMGLYAQHLGYYESSSLFVKKGMTIKDNGSTLSSYTLEFFPIS